MNIQGQASGLKRQELFLIVKIPPFSHGQGALVTSDVDLDISSSLDNLISLEVMKRRNFHFIGKALGLKHLAI